MSHHPWRELSQNRRRVLPVNTRKEVTANSMWAVGRGWGVFSKYGIWSNWI